MGTVRVYVYFSRDELDELLRGELYQMVENQDGLVEARHMRINM